MGEFRHFMSDLLLWMHARSHEGEPVLASVQSTDKFDNGTLFFAQRSSAEPLKRHRTERCAEQQQTSH